MTSLLALCVLALGVDSTAHRKHTGPSPQASAANTTSPPPRCSATKFRIGDGEWTCWEPAYNALCGKDLPPHPVRVTVDAVRCGRSGCCPVEVWVRPRTSDPLVVQQLMVEDEYSPVFEGRWPTLQYILDAGANVGYASVLYALFAPDAQIISVEAHPDNFRLLKKNVAQFPNVHPVHAGLWGHRANVSVIPGNRKTLQEWQFRVTEGPEMAGHVKRGRHKVRIVMRPNSSAVPIVIPALPVDDLLRRFRFPRLDLAKIDIEGAEREVFAGATVQQWLANTSLLVLELHDDMNPGCTAAVERAIKASGHRPYPKKDIEYRVWTAPWLAHNDL